MKKLILINKWVLVFIIIIPLFIFLLSFLLLQMKVEKTFSGNLISNKESKAEFVLASKSPSKFKKGHEINFYIDSKFYKSYIRYASIKEDGKIHIELDNIAFDILKNQVIPAKVIYSSQTLWDSIINNSL